MTETALTVTPTGAQIAEQVVIKGDLSKLTEAERMAYYSEVCRSLGLNPLTRPFEYINLNGRLTLYATRAAGDQLRSIRGITITGLDPRQVGDLFVVVATGRDRTGREDSSTGAVSTKGLAGEALANAMMKAETKAKRRLTLSLAGLGWSDETEVESLGEPVVTPRPTLAERAATRAVATPEPASETAAGPIAGEFTADEIAEDLTVPEGLTAHQLVALAKAAGKNKAHIAEAIGCPLADITARLGGMTDVERGVLADELGINWRAAS